MPNVSGPIEMVLLEKDDRKYLLIADRHTPWNEGGCPSHIPSEILPQYLSTLFRENSQNQWDFYIEQGVIAVDDKQKESVKFLSKTKNQTSPKDLQKLRQIYEEDLQNPVDSMTLTYDYFRSQGCFFIDELSPNKNPPDCNKNFSNVRFHFIDTRQANFGECKVPSLSKYIGIGLEGKLLYSGLFDVVTKMAWDTRDELTELLNDYVDNYFYQVNTVLKCLGERKVRKQHEVSVMSKELEEYFVPAIGIISTVLNAIKTRMAPARSEIANTVLLLVDKVMPELDSSLKRGQPVKISGLTSETGRQLNGKIGTVISPNEDGTRWLVQVMNNGSMETKALKPDNLTVLTYSSLYIQSEAINESLGNQIIGGMPDIVENKLFGIDYRQDLLDQINSSPYIKISNGVKMNEFGDFDITHVLFDGDKLIMDMYALGRMTKPYNKNVVLLAGYLHMKNYLNFFTKNGFTIKWNGKPQPMYPKCIEVPQWDNTRGVYSSSASTSSYVPIQASKPWHHPLTKFFGLKGGKPSPQSCCNHTRKAKKCIRKDGKLFSLPRKFTRKRCLEKRKQGYTMKASCAPYKNCKKPTQMKKSKKSKPKAPQFLYHPDNPDKSFDVYIDKNPKDTIPIKYSSLDDVRETIKKLERLYKAGKYSHKRIWQVGMIMKVRLDAIKKHHPHVRGINQRQKLAEKYFKFLGERTKTAKSERKKMVFTPLNN
jgi:hypothetical protein